MSGSTSASPTVSHSSGSSLPNPVEAVASAVRQVPGAHAVKGVFDGVLDSIGAVSPHARRVAAYAGVGLLGAAGVVEWPVAAAGAAVVWLTQPLRRNAPKPPAAKSAPAPEPSAAPRTRTRTTAAKPSTTKAGAPKAGAAKAATAEPRAARKSKGAGTAPGRPRPAGRKRSGTTASTTASTKASAAPAAGREA